MNDTGAKRVGEKNDKGEGHSGSQGQGQKTLGAAYFLNDPMLVISYYS